MVDKADKMEFEVPKTLTQFFQYAVYVVFAVVIGLSFEISRDIVIPFEQIPHHWIQVGILVLSYIIIVTSWIGYFLSIRTSPNKGKLGFIRFVLDLVIIYIFYYMVSLADKRYYVHRQDIFVYILPFLFGVFITWDIVKFFEYKRKNESRGQKLDRRRRIFITADYFIVFLLLSVIYSSIVPYLQHGHNLISNIDSLDITFIIASIILIIMYRIAKQRDTISIKAQRRHMRRNKKNGQV